MRDASSQLSWSEQASVFPGKVPLLGHLPVFFWSLWRAKGNLASAVEHLFCQVDQQTFRFKLGPQWCILTVDPVVMHHILVTEFAQHTKTQHERDVLHPSMTGGLITAEGEEWKAHRQIIQPFFSMDYVKRLTTLAREAVTDRVIQWHDRIDVGYEMQMVTFDIIARFFLGGKVGHYAGEESLDFYVDHLRHMEKVLESRVFSFPRLKDFIINSLKFKTRANKSIHVIKGFISHRIQSSADEEHSILQQLLKEFGSKDIIIKEMLNIISASLGSAHVLTWICALLAQDPYRQKKLKTEIEHFFSDRKDKNGITLEQLDQLTYLTAVIHEGLRLYPPAPYIIRTLSARPAAPLIILSIWSMQRHPALWTQPKAFEPERWLAQGDTTEASPDTARQLRTFAAFLPFGTGPRMCIGRGFALIEIKLILIDIMQRFTLRLVDPVLPTAKATILTRPKQRIRLEVEPVTDVQDA
jgi:cytochrome P450